MSEHLNGLGQFFSDKYIVTNPKTGRQEPNIVPIKLGPKTAHILWPIVDLYEKSDPEFSEDLKQAIVNAGLAQSADPKPTDLFRLCRVSDGKYSTGTTSPRWTKRGKFFVSKAALMLHLGWFLRGPVRFESELDSHGEYIGTSPVPGNKPRLAADYIVEQLKVTLYDTLSINTLINPKD